MNDLRLIAVPAAQLIDAWPRVAHWFAALSDTCGGRHTSRDLAERVISRDVQLWAAADDADLRGVMLSEILKYPQQTDAHFFAAAGSDAAGCVRLIPQFSDWARMNECDVLKVTGRPGWEKLLKPFGFERTAIVLEKKL